MVAHLSMEDQVAQGLLLLLLCSLLFPSCSVLCLHVGSEWEPLVYFFVDFGLEGRHRAWIVLDDFWWELFQDLLLGAPQDKRCDSPLQALERVDEGFCLFEILRHLLDVRCQILVVGLVEHCLFLEEVRHQEIEEGPELGHSVLQRRS